MYANVQQRARVAKAQADVRTLVSAVTIYSAHMGALLTALTDLTSAAVNSGNQSAGPFMARVPAPPATWAAYAYARNFDLPGTFTVSSSSAGDAATVSLP